jgi:PAS domain S-box-containing protein
MKHLQYSFFIDSLSNLIPCDAASEEFLKSIDPDSFQAHLQSLELNNANLATTILLNHTSYTLRLVPVSAMRSAAHARVLDNWNGAYIAVLQDQVSLSSVLYTLGKGAGSEDVTSDMFEDFDTGIYVTRADGVSMFINSRYEEITGIRREDAVGQTIFTLHSQGMYMPLVTPVILRINKEYTVLQAFAGERYGIISGTPIYDASGKPFCVLICVNQIEEKALRTLDNTFSPQAIARGKSAKLEYVQESAVDIIAESAAVRQVMQDSIRVAHYDVPVLLLGESGTGKEIFASIIHSSGPRRFEPYVTLNCSAISPSLLEAELFGYEPGSFTGASSKGKQGFFEVATKGTIFLDEIGDMPLESQAKLLRVLQNGEFYKVGGVEPIKTNARIVAATNRNLKEMVEQGTFRRDLYYRLNVIPITMPALRDRKEDIAPLLLHFLYVFNQNYGTNKRFSDDLIELLTEYNWPGNVRELKNLVRRLIIMSVDDLLTPSHFYRIWSEELALDQPEEPVADGVVVNGLPQMTQAVAEVEKTLVERALEKGGSTRRAAELLGVSQSTVMRKIREFGISE